MEPSPDQVQRLAAVRAAAAVRWRTDPVLTPSDSRDTWLLDEPVLGPVVLRIAWRGDRGRLVTEAKVGRALPAAVGYPPVVGFGWTRDEADLTWSLTRRLPGATLAAAWPELTGRRRAEAVATLTRMLAALYAWRPSAAVSDRLLARPATLDLPGVLGADLLPLPAGRIDVLGQHAQRLPLVDAALVRQAVAWLGRRRHLMPELDRPGLAVTHQDLHLDNVWWDGRRVTALLDLEWVRLAEPWTDLCRMADHADTDLRAGLDAHQRWSRALEQAVPALRVGELAERLRLGRMAVAVRQLFLWPLAEGEPVPADHPRRTLERLLA